MYIPAQFEVKDIEKIFAFINEFPFAILVSNGVSSAPVATHLPFISEKDGNKITLHSHIAAINPQCTLLVNSDKEVLVIFNGPHAYISPELYEIKKTVPTWNYAAVHITGKIKFIEDKHQSYFFLQKLISHFEPTFSEKFANLHEQYVSALMAEIKVFSIEVSNLEASYKLSQNKSKNDRQNIIDSLNKSGLLSDLAFAQFMHQNL